MNSQSFEYINRTMNYQKNSSKPPKHLVNYHKKKIVTFDKLKIDFFGICP